MRWKKYIVDLSEEDRSDLEKFVSTGEHRAEAFNGSVQKS